MRKLSTLLIVLIIPFLLMTPVLVVPVAYAPAPTTVHISGKVSVSGATVHMQANAKGTAASLTGKGSDSAQFIGAPGFPPGECTFNNLSGSISGSVVTLAGSVTQSSNPAFIGIPVTIIGDASTGSITFIFNGFTLTGTGTVVIT